MNFFWKITRGELDKIFVRPAIFIMTGFFILAIVASIFMYKPSDRTDLIECANISGDTVNEVFTNFNNNQNKLVFDADFANIKSIIDFYSGDNLEVATKDDLMSKFELLSNSILEYQELVNSYSIGSKTPLIEAKSKIKPIIEDLTNLYEEINASFLTMLIKNDVNNNINTLLNQLSIAVAISGDEQDLSHHKRVVENLVGDNILKNLKQSFDTIEEIKVSQELLDNLTTSYYIIANERLFNIYNEMSTLNSEASTSTEANASKANIDKIKMLADNYKLTIFETKNIVNDKIMLAIVDDRPTSSLKNYTYTDLQDFNKYKAKENLTKNLYLFENNQFLYQYANVFQSNANSNEKTNAYDFMFYALEFLSFIIIIYCVIIGSGMISGETSSGTMKMLAIRPYKRHKIITGKLVATIFVGIIFLIIGTLTTFIIGARLYGLSSLPILMIFNAEIATPISAVALFFIFLGLLLVRIIVYTILAVFISTAFKSNIAAVIISIMIYVFVAVFGNLFGSSPIYGYLPFANVDLFRFLGGDSSSESLLGLNFSCPIQPDLNFYISLAIVASFVAILLIATYYIFKRRDID